MNNQLNDLKKLDAVNCREDYAQLKKILNAYKNSDDIPEKSQAFLQEHESLNRLIDVLKQFAELYLIENDFSDCPTEQRTQARKRLSNSRFEKLVQEVEL